MSESEPRPATTHRIRLFAGLLLACVIVVALVALPVKDLLQKFLERVGGMGFWGGVILTAAYVFACVLFVPGSILTMGSGFAFGVVWGTVVVSVGSTVGASVSFLLGRTLLRGWIEAKVAKNAKFRAIDRAVEREGFKIVLLSRLSPVFPFNLLNYAFGVTKVRFSQFVLASWMGMLPGTVMYVYIGSAVRSLAEIASGKVEGGPGQKILFGAGLVATVAVAWFVARMARRAIRGVIPEEPRKAETAMQQTTEMKGARLLPDDPHDQELVSHVRPTPWKNPEPADRYNLVVIGGGPAGLVAAAGAAGLGAKVALVEKHLLGGDCLNVGCVPSKALLRSARAYADVRDAGAFGIDVPDGFRSRFPDVMERMRRLRASLAKHDSADRFRSLGIDVFLGSGSFVDPCTFEVEGSRLRFKRALVSTGARAVALPIPGLAESGCLTNETVFTLTDLPPRLGVIGAGPIGCELAQAFARLGSRVTLFEVAPQILIREDRDAAFRIERALVRDGVELVLGCNLKEVRANGQGKTIVHDNGETVVDEILVGVGRAPNVEGLNLEAASIEYDTKNGIIVDDSLRTTNSHVYAAGDVCFPYKFTHVADAMARIVLRNALFMGGRRASALTIPWCTYTDPEIAHVGMYEKEAMDKGIRVQTFMQDFENVDRAVLDGETEGFIKVHVAEGTDRILGATIVARHAGEMISELTLAMKAGVGLATLGETIHPYPTQSEAIRKIADQYARTKLTPRIAGLLRGWLRWRR